MVEICQSMSANNNNNKNINNTCWFRIFFLVIVGGGGSLFFQGCVHKVRLCNNRYFFIYRSSFSLSFFRFHDDHDRRRFILQFIFQYDIWVFHFLFACLWKNWIMMMEIIIIIIIWFEIWGDDDWRWYRYIDKWCIFRVYSERCKQCVSCVIDA